MTFLEVLEQVRGLLQSQGRVSYRALKRQFELDDEYVADLKEELLFSYPQVADEDGRGLVWVGVSPVSGSTFQVSGSQPPDTRRQTLDPRPISYTPPHLAERILAEQAAMETRGATEGERKTITALFADLKGSTALIEGLDPEEARAIIDPALQLIMDAVHRYDGYVAQALGDGIFALFGAPIAHEDHPQRALYAALRMQEEMRRYSDQLRLKGGAPLYMRVGVNTGEVVVRSIRKDDLHTDYVPVGHSTNLAARMEQMATPGSILITEHTRKLTEGYFDLKALGAAAIKGVEEPLNVYEVLGAGPMRTRLQISARRGLTRFVGRQSEMDQMRQALEQVKAGHGQIVGVMGEPGLGKSRLFREFVGAVREPPLRSQSGCLVLEAYSVSYGKASPYLSLIELLKSYFQIQPQDDERTRREKVGGKVLMLDRSLEDTLPYLFSLLSLEDQTSSLQQMDPQIRRRRTFEALKRVFLRESLNQPLILIFEDLHWIDSETQGFLDVLSESVATAKVLVLVNYRPEYRHEWGSKTYYTQVRLAPLGKEEVEEFLTVLLGTTVGAQHAAPLQALKQLILEKTDGTPFFMEEVVQTLAEEQVLVGERGNYRLEKAPMELHISPTVQGVLAARIDRLSPVEKELLHQLAVVGREFPLSLVRQVVAQPEEELYRLLASLQSKEFLYEQPAFPEVEYTFKHALTQEVAYGSVLQERRKALHERTAQAIEALYSAGLEDHYSDLAHHYSRSGNARKTVEYLHLAGQQAVPRSADAEAIGHLTTALELLKTLPDTPERVQRELALQLTVAGPLIAIKGYNAPDVETVYGRARELCQQIGDPFQLFPVLEGLWLFHHMRADLETASTIEQQALSIAQQTRNALFLARAHNSLGATLSFLGDQTSARDQLEQGLILADSQQLRSQDFVLIADPALDIRSHAARLLWLLGFPDQALKRGAEAVALAREQGHVASLCVPLTFVAWCHLFRGEADKARELADTLITVAAEHGFAFHSGTGMVMLGRALVQQGQLEEGLAQVRQGWAEQQATGSRLNQSYNLAFLAETYGKMGQANEGLSLVTEALAVVNTTHEAWWEAELYRLKGTLTLQKFQIPGSKFQVPNPQSLTPNPQTEAEACLHKAIDIARRQQAKSLELRAATSLARLWQQQGKKAETHELLSEIYNWFTEGFDTKDLQDAKALLEELA